VTRDEFWALFDRFVETDDEDEAAALGDQIINEIVLEDFEKIYCQESSGFRQPEPFRALEKDSNL
jgi:hypothetical protein